VSVRVCVCASWLTCGSRVAREQVSPDVYVFDYTKHASKPSDNFCNPQLRLKGHTKEGYGLSWSHLRNGYLLSTSDDGSICMWDINANNAESGVLNALQKFMGHSSVVEDAAWHSQHENIFASVGDDQQLLLYGGELSLSLSRNAYR